MPSKKGERPQIHVEKTSYNFINLEKLEIIGTTSLKTLQILNLKMISMNINILQQIVNYI